MLPSKNSDDGSAAVDFLAFGIPGVLILLIACQLVYASFLKTVAFDAAAEAASVASTADGTEVAAGDRAHAVARVLTGVEVRSVEVSGHALGGVSVSQVTVILDSPVLGFGLIPVGQTVEAIDEPR